MSPEDHNTRVWWDGDEVVFIRWTEKSLVFSWNDVTETAIHMPRGAVLRLLQKGVLQVKGEMPTWTHLEPFGSEKSDPSAAQEPPSPTVPSVPEKQQKPERVSAISKLIRKLGGGDHSSARVSG
jgi:hypothetical protein